MPMKSLTPDLMVEDVEATVEWYERVFDAEVVATLPTDAEADHWWVQVLIDDSLLMFQERGSLVEKLPDLEGEAIGGSVAFYVDIDDARSLHDDLESAGVEVIQPLHETDFGWRQFAVKDCNGYILWFGEKLPGEEVKEIGRRQRTYHDEHLTDVVSGQTERETPERPPGRG